MKTQTIVTEITHEDLVNLFSTATYNSSWLGLGASYNSNDYKSCNERNTIEENLANIILGGGTIYMQDHYAEDKDNFYGDLPHKWYSYTANDGWMEYTFSLEDIKKGVAKALDSGEYIANYVRHWADQDCEFDNPQAEAIMQWIIFGEEIYG